METEKSQLVTLIKKLNQQGHNPGTSGNYSLRPIPTELVQQKPYVYVSQSGLDKEFFELSHLLKVDLESGLLLENNNLKNIKSSDETEVHLAIYRNTNAGCVLHSHMESALLFAELFPEKMILTITQMEMIKVFPGITSHEEILEILCYPNTQDIKKLATIISPNLKIKRQCNGLILRDHGIYVWGENVKETKKHLEAFDYLFHYVVKKALLKK